MVVIVQGFDGPSSLAKEGIDQEQKNFHHAYFVSSVRHLDPLSLPASSYDVACSG
jgi:hypothetical protein